MFEAFDVVQHQTFMVFSFLLAFSFCFLVCLYLVDEKSLKQRKIR